MPRLKSSLAVLKKRSSFLAVAATRKKWVAPTLVLQVGPIPPEKPVSSEKKESGCDDAAAVARPRSPVPLHYGITATRKVGGAVQRNRARRRLRALVFDVMVQHAKRDQAYVLVARLETVTCDATALRRDLETALKRFHLWCDQAGCNKVGAEP